MKHLRRDFGGAAPISLETGQSSSQEPPRVELEELLPLEPSKPKSSVLFKLTDECCGAIQEAIKKKYKVRLNYTKTSCTVEVGYDRGENETKRFTCVVQSNGIPMDVICRDNGVFRNISSLSTKIQVRATDKTFAETREKAQKLVEEQQKRKTMDMGQKFNKRLMPKRGPIAPSFSASKKPVPHSKPSASLNLTPKSNLPPKAAPSNAIVPRMPANINQKRPANSERPANAERSERPANAERSERPANAERSERPVNAERSVNIINTSESSSVVPEPEPSAPKRPKVSNTSTSSSLALEENIDRFSFKQQRPNVEQQRLNINVPTKPNPILEMEPTVSVKEKFVATSTSSSSSLTPDENFERIISQQRISSTVSSKPINTISSTVEIEPLASTKEKFVATSTSSSSSLTPDENLDRFSSHQQPGSLTLPTKPTRDWAQVYGDIKDVNEAKKYHEIFKYPEYLECYKMLLNVANEFSELEKQLKSTQINTPNYDKIEDAIQTKFANYQQDEKFLSKRQKHTDLRTKLDVLKQRINAWEKIYLP